METITDNPLLLGFLIFVGQSLAAITGWLLLKRHRMTEEMREDFGRTVTASLTLLSLVIGFAFSMAISRYDQRKDYEEAEANAIWDGIPPLQPASGRVSGACT